MSKERLEKIKEQLEESNSYDDNPNGYWYHNINWLIEQAERVQELEEDLKLSEEEEDKRFKESKRYREALEFYANRDNYKLEHFDPNLDECMSTVDYDEGAEARKALKGDSE